MSRVERFEWNKVPEKGKWFQGEFWDRLMACCLGLEVLFWLVIGIGVIVGAAIR